MDNANTNTNANANANSNFSVSVHQNEFVADGVSDIHAVVTVAATGLAAAGGGTQRAVVIMGDRSGSMDEPLDPGDRRSTTKIIAARKALAAAIDQISDGTSFAVIGGNDHAQVLYPVSQTLAVASAATRTQAKAAIAHLTASGGTAMSTWLDLARQLFEPYGDAVRQGILITDGRNESESPAQLAGVLARCAPVFQCDSRGVGVNWEVAELRNIASQLHGEVDMIRRADQMTEDFAQLITAAVGKQVGKVSIRLWTPKSAETLYVKQVAPSIDDLTPKSSAISDRIRDYPLGAWGDEERDYHVCIRVRPGGVGDEMLAARVSAVVDDEVVGEGLVRAVWTDDVTLSSRISPEVAHYTGQVELAAAVQEGLAARAAGDTHTATIKLGEAVKLAVEGGNTGTVRLLQKVVDIDDPATGTVRLKAAVDKGDEMELDTRSTKTVRVVKPS